MKITWSLEIDRNDDPQKAVTDIQAAFLQTPGTIRPGLISISTTYHGTYVAEFLSKAGLPIDAVNPTGH